MGMEKTASDRFLIVGVESKETSENHIIDLHNIKGILFHLLHFINLTFLSIFCFILLFFLILWLLIFMPIFTISWFTEFKLFLLWEVYCFSILSSTAIWSLFEIREIHFLYFTSVSFYYHFPTFLINILNFE